MRGFFLIIFFFIIVVIAVVYGAPSISTRSDPVVELKPSSDVASSPSILPVKPRLDTVIVAAPDGMVYLVELKSKKILGSFMSGTSIYSSYQALPAYQGDTGSFTIEEDNFYIDCGEDWKLYMHVNGFKKVELQVNAEELLKRTPRVSAKGIMLGSKKTTVFVIDAKTGKPIRTFRSEGLPLEGDTDIGQNPILARKDVEEWEAAKETGSGALNVFVILRTDYALQYTSWKTGKVLWYLKFADFEASQQCENIESFIGGLSDQEDHMNSGYVVYPIDLVVHRVRDQKSLDLVFGFNTPQNDFSGDRVLLLPTSDNYTSPPSLYENGRTLPPSVYKQGTHTLHGGPPSVYENWTQTMPGGPPSVYEYGTWIMPGGPPSLYENGTQTMHGGPPSVYQNETRIMPGGPPSVYKNGTQNLPGGPPSVYENGNGEMKSDASVHSYILKSVLSASVLLVVAIPFSLLWKWWKLRKQVTDPKLLAATSKKKKARKSGLSKNGTRNQKNNHSDDTEVSGEFPGVGKSDKVLKLNFSKYDSLGYHRKIGKMLVSNTEIAKGSNGTIILEGIYDGRPVAVKRLVQTHHEVALKEIQNLIASDQHPNIVRWYGVEYDHDFVYLSLERCTCSLYEFISSFSSSYQKQFSRNDQDACCFSDCTVQLQLKWGDKEDFPLWKPNGYPSPHLLKLMRDTVHGLAHLHELGIIHRDLKPQNVLVAKERSICAKISDMGISKRLAGDMSSLTKDSTGSGSSGWQAPEQLRQERQTRAVDLFSLGCVLFFCITGGNHPFGDSFERDVNILNNQKDLFLIESIPEAADLISALLHPEPQLRPKAVEIPHHPFFWDSEMRLSFLRDASDRVELEDRENGSKLLEALENVKTVALGGLWNEKMDSAFINDIGRYRRYKYDSVRDLLRVIRNKLNHYRELSKEIQGILGQVPEGFDSYFSTRFPRLVIEVYKIFRTFCIEEDIFQKYFKSDQI